MTRFIDMLPLKKVRDEKFMRMALAIEQAIEAFKDDGGDLAEVPMLCGVVIVNFAINSEDPKGFVAAIHRLMMMPFEERKE